MNANQFARIQLAHIKAATQSVRIEGEITQTEALVETVMVLLEEIRMTELSPTWDEKLRSVMDALTEYGIHLGDTR